MIEISPTVGIDDSDVQFEFVRASGPGGQNVNKVSTAVQLRYDVANSPVLDGETKARLIKLAGKRMSEGGILVIEAKRYRSQEQNREDALQRMVVLVRQALEKPKARRATRPSVTAKAARVSAKKKRGEIKRTRSHVLEEWE